MYGLLRRPNRLKYNLTQKGARDLLGQWGMKMMIQHLVRPRFDVLFSFWEVMKIVIKTQNIDKLSRPQGYIRYEAKLGYFALYFLN